MILSHFFPQYSLLFELFQLFRCYTYWQDILLPLLSTEDLLFLEDQSKGLIKGMITEELNTCIGYHQKSWHFLKKYIKENNFEIL